MLRKFALVAVSTTILLSAPAYAHDNNWCVELDAGATATDDHPVDVPVLASSVTMDHDTGFDTGGLVGYDFGMWRLEAEANYREAGIGAITLTSPGTPPTSVEFDGKDISGKSTALNFMLNALLDFGPDDGLSAQVGGGLGISRVKTNLVSLDSTDISDTDNGFAWQLLAGIRHPVTEQIDIGLKYRYLSINNIDFLDSSAGRVSDKWRSHSILASITYNFGDAPPPPLPPPPPPPG